MCQILGPKSIMAYVQHSSVFPLPPQDLYKLVSQIQHWGKFLPEDLSLKFVRGPKEIIVGAEYCFLLKRWGIETDWVMRVESLNPGQQFVERQILGLFEDWVHTVRFEAHTEKECRLHNMIEYRMPFGIFGRLTDDLLGRKDLKRILETSHLKLRKYLLSKPERS
jgi:ligand-binding SRPBCC domain-containing protein